MNWYLTALKKYFEFNGRSRRKEYWMFLLINFVISLILFFIDYKLGWTYINHQTCALMGVLSSIYSLFVFIPSLAVTVRRLHDTGKSAWFLLFPFIPLIGILLLLAFMVIDSDPDENVYGPNPKNS